MGHGSITTYIESDCTWLCSYVQLLNPCSVSNRCRARRSGFMNNHNQEGRLSTAYRIHMTNGKRANSILFHCETSRSILIPVTAVDPRTLSRSSVTGRQTSRHHRLTGPGINQVVLNTEMNGHDTLVACVTTNQARRHRYRL